MTKIITILLIPTIFCFAHSSTKDNISFKGKVIYNSFEMGFWGIVTDKGKKLDGSIPKMFQIKGLRVKGLYRERKGSVSFRMWGTPVKFLKIEKEF